MYHKYAFLNSDKSYKIKYKTGDLYQGTVFKFTIIYNGTSSYVVALLDGYYNGRSESKTIIGYNGFITIYSKNVDGQKQYLCECGQNGGAILEIVSRLSTIEVSETSDNPSDGWVKVTMS